MHTEIIPWHSRLSFLSLDFYNSMSEKLTHFAFYLLVCISPHKNAGSSELHTHLLNYFAVCLSISLYFALQQCKFLQGMTQRGHTFKKYLFTDYRDNNVKKCCILHFRIGFLATSEPRLSFPSLCDV